MKKNQIIRGAVFFSVLAISQSASSFAGTFSVTCPAMQAFSTVVNSLPAGFSNAGTNLVFNGATVSNGPTPLCIYAATNGPVIGVTLPKGFSVKNCTVSGAVISCNNTLTLDIQAPVINPAAAGVIRH